MLRVVKVNKYSLLLDVDAQLKFYLLVTGLVTVTGGCSV